MAKLREVEGGRGSWKEVREVEVDSFFLLKKSACWLIKFVRLVPVRLFLHVIGFLITQLLEVIAPVGLGR